MTEKEQIRMFCKICKKFLNNNNAKYCAYCGCKLEDTQNYFLAREELTIEWICSFLKEVLGYSVVEIIDNNNVMAQYKAGDDLSFDSINISLHSDRVDFGIIVRLSSDVSNDLQFFKSLNKANYSSSFVFLFHKPDDQNEIDDELKKSNTSGNTDNIENSEDNYEEDIRNHGHLSISYSLSLSPIVPLHNFYGLAESDFTNAAQIVCAKAGLFPYLPFYRVVAGPYYLKQQKKLIQIVEDSNKLQKIHVFIDGGFREVINEDNISWDDLSSAIKIPLKMFFSILNGKKLF